MDSSKKKKKKDIRKTRFDIYNVNISVANKALKNATKIQINFFANCNDKSKTFDEKFNVKLYSNLFSFNLILYGPYIMQYICNPTRYTIFDD